MKLFLVSLVLLCCRCDLFATGGLPNPRPIKTIETSHGDIFDCVDIHKQPAFDNPLLKDHQILMQPNVHLENITVEGVWEANGKEINVELEDGGCPYGTVPVHRLLEKNSTLSNDDVKMFWAIRQAIPRHYYGASSSLNVYGVHPVGPNQVSAAMIWVSRQDVPREQMPLLDAGWSVDPQLYNDEKTRLTIAWSNNGAKSGCTNLKCPGFVHTNRKIGLGVPLMPVSTYKGTQYYVSLYIYKDEQSNWWLAYGDVKNTVGYWPASLFKGGFEYATVVEFGGFVKCVNGEVCPAMGSGVRSFEHSACTMRRVQVVGPDHHWGGLGPAKEEARMTNRNCYDVGPYQKDDHAYKFAFGGRPCHPNGDR